MTPQDMREAGEILTALVQLSDRINDLPFAADEEIAAALSAEHIWLEKARAFVARPLIAAVLSREPKAEPQADEREALAHLLNDTLEKLCHEPDDDDLEWCRLIADALLAAGFRRSAP